MVGMHSGMAHTLAHTLLSMCYLPDPVHILAHTLMPVVVHT